MTKKFSEDRILFVPDAHLPYVDREIFRRLMRVAKYLEPTRIVVLGDWLDCYSVSSHAKSPARFRRLVDELQDSTWALDALDKIPCKRKDFLLGNHEFRLQRLIDSGAPALHGIEALTIEALMDLQSRGWVVHKYMVELEIGSLRVCHDYGASGRNSLGRAITTMDSSIVQGHTHLLQTEHRTSKGGAIVSGNSFGWLGSLSEIDYCHRGIALHTWRHGCGVGWTRPDGTVRREGVPLDSSRIVVNGKVI